MSAGSVTQTAFVCCIADCQSAGGRQFERVGKCQQFAGWQPANRSNSIRPLLWISLRRTGEIGLLRKDLVTATQRVEPKSIGRVGVVGVSGAALKKPLKEIMCASRGWVVFITSHPEYVEVAHHRDFRVVGFVKDQATRRAFQSSKVNGVLSRFPSAVQTRLVVALDCGAPAGGPAFAQSDPF